MRTLSRPVYLLLVLLFCLSWSTSFPATKMALNVSPPLLFLGVRFAIAGLMLLAWAAWRGELRVPQRVPWRALLVLGLLNQAGYQGLFWLGMSTNSAGMATVMGSLNPILISTVAAPLLGERLHARKLAGLMLGLAGALFIVRHRIAIGESPAGIALFALGLVSMSAGTILYKKLAPEASLAVAVGAQQLAAGFALLIAGILTESVSAVTVSSPMFWATMTWFILVVSIGALMLWFFLLGRGSASSASALHFLMPPLGLFMSWVAIGEQPNWLDLLGVVPVAAGIWLATRPPPPSRPVPALATR